MTLNTLPLNQAVITRMVNAVLANVGGIKKVYPYVPMSITKADTSCAIGILDAETADDSKFGKGKILEEESTYIILVLHAELTVAREGEANKQANLVHNGMKFYLASQNGLMSAILGTNLVTESTYRGNNGIKPTEYPLDSGIVFLGTEYTITTKSVTNLVRRA